jgi:hypothetical protein
MCKRSDPWIALRSLSGVIEEAKGTTVGGPDSKDDQVIGTKSAQAQL